MRTKRTCYSVTVLLGTVGKESAQQAQSHAYVGTDCSLFAFRDRVLS